MLSGEKRIRYSRVYELEFEGRRPVGWLKKAWRKVEDEDMRKVNITEDKADRN